MKEILTVINQKGGVGKSTTALSLGAGLTRKGFGVLYVDLDAQGNLSHTLRTDSRGPTVLDLLTEQGETAGAIQHTQGGDVIPASPALAGADAVITATGKEYKLREALEPVKGSYDYIIIDTPPALGVLTVNALTACTGAIIPAQADVYSLQGIAQLYTTIDTVRKYCNRELQIKGILLTRYSARSVLSRDIAAVIQQTAAELGTRLFKTRIRENIAVKESQANQQDIYRYAAKSNAAADYDAFVDELLERS